MKKLLAFIVLLALGYIVPIALHLAIEAMKGAF